MLVFFPAMLIVWAIARKLCGLPMRPVVPAASITRPIGVRTTLLNGCVAGLLAAVLVWAGYNFSIGRAGDMRPEAVSGAWQILPPPAERGAFQRLALESRIPAPELVHGLFFLAAHDRSGHPSYLLGQNSQHGFWYFYPVSLFFKTPLPFFGAVLLAMALFVSGALRLRPSPLSPRRSSRRFQDPLAVALALTTIMILVVSARSNINLGIRHVIMVYPLVAVAVARFVDAWLERVDGSPRRTVAGTMLLLVGAQAASAIIEHPVHLAFANRFAGAEPARVMLDSDLEWGQSLVLLREEAERRGIKELTLGYLGAAKPCQHGLPPLRPLLPDRRATGWIAISENFYRERSYSGLLRDPCDAASFIPPAEIKGHPFRWLSGHRPVTIVGNTLRLYHLP